jgi:uncharacterized protein with HEPN domain
MSDQSLIYEKLLQIEAALERINRRFSGIESPDDFLDSDRGLDMLDGIGMMLIAIGENLKKIDRDTQGLLLQRYNSIDWKGAKGVRDILSHHYFDLDATEIFNICQKEIPALTSAIELMISEYKNPPTP